MKLTRAQKEAKLRKAAEELVDRLLEWDEENKAPNLTQIEDEVREVRSGDALQGEKREGGRESGRRTRGGTRLLLLCLLQERAFPPWTGNLS